MNLIQSIYSIDSLSFIWGLRPFEMFLILVVVLLLFGTKKLPDLARGFGKAIREFKKSASGVEKDIREAMDSTESAEVQPAPVVVEKASTGAKVESEASASSDRGV